MRIMWLMGGFSLFASVSPVVLIAILPTVHKEFKRGYVLGAVIAWLVTWTTVFGGFLYAFSNVN